MARLKEEYLCYQESGAHMEETEIDNLYEDVGNKPIESKSSPKAQILKVNSEGKYWTMLDVFVSRELLKFGIPR